MITKCVTCGAPLAHDAPPPRCARCGKPYCSLTCLIESNRSGHEFFCNTVQRCGGAEQFHADGKYEEAVEVAVAKCADDTKGQTCYIDVIREVVTTLTEIERTARRVLGDGHPTTVNIARFLQIALRDLHNAVETLAETERSTRRVLGSAHPVTAGIEAELRDARATLAASETPSPLGA